MHDARATAERVDVVAAVDAHAFAAAFGAVGRIACILSILFLSATRVAVAQDTGDLAKAAQNPVAAMISLPFQNNILFGVGPDEDDVANVLNIQPVIPFTVATGT